MEGKVKFVRRDVWLIENQEYSNDSDIHARRCTATYAVLYNQDEVEIDEDDIRITMIPDILQPALFRL